MQSTLKELRELGLIETKKERIGGQIMTLSRLTDPNFWTPEINLLISWIQRNKKLLRNSNFYKNLPNIPAEPGDEEKFLKINFEGALMSDFPAAYDPEDVDDARRRFALDKHQAKVEKMNARDDKRMKKRSMDPSKWSVTDSCFEFASRMFDLWHVKPWQLGQSRFRIALGNARSTYGTDGVLENLMYEKFFKTVAHNKALNDPEILWKMFIKQFGTLLASVQQEQVTDARVEQAAIQAVQSKDRLKQFAEEEGI